MPKESQNEQVKITLDVGTVYDFFQSLAVLRSPKKYGVRGAWASGMLARLSAESRETLAWAGPVAAFPMHMLPSLPQPKNVETLLWHLGQMDAVERLRALSCPWELEACGCVPLFEEVADRGTWGKADLERLREAYCADEGKAPPDKKLTSMLDIWVDPEGFGDAYLAALRNYQEAFFAEEETRIEPVIRAAADRFADRIDAIPVKDLIEEISSGIRYETMPDVAELVIAPSFWISPLLLTIELGERSRLLVFGARTARDSIVPGETVPEGLVRALKALSDPTRLKTLRLISRKPMGAAEIARTLRLRTPTMLHHLHALRLSGLIRIQVPEPHAKEKATYSLRPQAIEDVLAELSSFMTETDDTEPGT